MLATLQTIAAKFPLRKVFTATLRMLCCSCLVAEMQKFTGQDNRENQLDSE